MTAAATHRRNAGRQALDGGMLLAGVGAVALLVSLFLDWWGPSGDLVADGGSRGITGWNVFELVDVLLAVLALVVLGSSIEHIARRRLSIPPPLSDAAGPIALVLIVISLVNEPPLLVLSAGTDVEAGAWLALGGALVMTVGSLLRYARISITVAPRERVVDPESETRPLAEEPRRTPP